MKRKFTLSAAILLLVTLSSSAQLSYRSNQTGGNYSWFTVANWEVYNTGSMAWEPAANYPTSTDGAISIVDADSLVITGATPLTIDQVTITANAKLSLFGNTFGLADGAGTDLQVDGKFYMGTNGILEGEGNVAVSSGGTITVRNNARLKAVGVNDGNAVISGNAYFQDKNFTNNGILTWLDNFFIVNSSTFTNNGTILIPGTVNRYMNSGPATQGLFINAAGGTIIKQASGSIVGYNEDMLFQNQGTMKGFGLYDFRNVVSNTGVMEAGNNAPGSMTVAPLILSGQSAEISSVLHDAGTAGTDYSILYINGSQDVNLSNLTLTVTEASGASIPAGSTFTLMEITNTTFPSFTGTFATVNLPAGYGNLQVNARTVTVEKISALPVQWGSFTVSALNENSVVLNWSTLQEQITSHFVVEHSTDGISYQPVGNVKAAGNSDTEIKYAYRHNAAVPGIRNYYRIAQYDLDGKSTLSEIKFVVPNPKSEVRLIAGQNPVINGTLTINLPAHSNIVISGADGRVYNKMILQSGIRHINIANLPAGIYYISANQDNNKTITDRFIKN